MLFISDEYDLALEYFNKILKINPEHVETLVDIALVHNDLEDYDKALKYLNKALKIDPDYYPILAQISNVYTSKGDYENADKYVNLSKIHFDRWTLIEYYHICYGISLGIMEKYGEAIKIHDEYLENTRISQKREYNMKKNRY